jgi:uncharacterized protein (TIGR02246 family)
MRAQLFSLTLIVMLTACGSASSGLSDADKAAIRNASQKYVETVNAQNVDGWLQQVSDNAVFMPLNHAPVEGRKAISAWQNETMKSLGPTKLALTLAEIEGRGDLAFVRGAYSTTLNGANTGTGNYVEIWQKQSDGSWRVIRDVWNTNADVTSDPAAEAAIRKLPIDWCAAEKARDLDAKMRLFTPDAVFIPPGERPVIGQPAMRTWHEAEWKQNKYECTPIVDEVQIVGESAFVRGTFSGFITPTKGGAPKRDSGNFVDVVRRQLDGSWKIARVIWNG